MDKKTKRLAFWTYMTVSAAVALVYILLTGGDKYTPVARFGGAAWVFLLSLIVTMPIFIPWAKKKHGDGSDSNESMMHHH